MAQKITRKISIAVVAHKTRLQKAVLAIPDADRPTKEIPVCRILGTATSYTLGVNKDTQQEFVKFSGNFRATDIMPDGANGEASGESTDAGVCILPNFLNGPLMTALDTTKQPVSFGLEVGVMFDAKSATGYVFGVKNLMPAQPQSDPLLALEVQMGLKPADALQIGNTSAPAPAPAVEEVKATSKRK